LTVAVRARYIRGMSRPRRILESLVLTATLVSCDHTVSGPSGTNSGRLATIEFETGTLVLTAAQPAPGGVVPVETCEPLCTSSGPELGFRFVPKESLTRAQVTVEFYDEQGRVCAEGATEYASLVPMVPVDLELKGVTFSACSYAGSFASVRTVARLYVARTLPPGLTTESREITLPYSFAGPALSRVATAPIVLAIEWDDNAGPTGGDKPLPGDHADYGCRVNDLDGDALRVELHFQDVGGRCPGSACWTETQAFARRPFPYAVSAKTRKVHPADPFGLGFDLTCTVTDSRALRAARVEHFR
jgi:hypothetical protein